MWCSPRPAPRVWGAVPSLRERLALGKPLKGPAEAPVLHPGFFGGRGGAVRVQSGSLSPAQSGAAARGRRRGTGTQVRQPRGPALSSPRSPRSPGPEWAQHRMPGMASTWGGVPPCPPHPCLLCPPRSTPTRDTASAARSPASTMKSRCCTFYRNTSEPLRPGACTFRAQVASPPPRERAGGASAPPRPLPAAPSPSAPAGQPHPGGLRLR